MIQLSAENAARVQQASLNQQSQLAEEETGQYEPSDVIQQQHAQQAELQALINEEKKKIKVTVKIFGRKTPVELGFGEVERE